MLAAADLLEHLEDELSGSVGVMLGALEVGKVVDQVGVRNLLLQEVLLVQEQDDGTLLEPPGQRK